MASRFGVSFNLKAGEIAKILTSCSADKQAAAKSGHQDFKTSFLWHTLWRGLKIMASIFGPGRWL